MTPEELYEVILKEREKLAGLPLGSPEAYRQSLRLDKLIVAYYQALADERRLAE